jgi:hypothetical protein
MLLKIKAIIYKYTGIFLAHKEENEFMQSKEFWKNFNKIINHAENDMSATEVQGLLIGSWQFQHGFYRPLLSLRYKKPAIVFIPLAAIATLFKVIKWDLQKLIPSKKEVKKKKGKKKS